jgi:hypothetical protein
MKRKEEKNPAIILGTRAQIVWHIIFGVMSCESLKV